jgi:Tat protein translocase TatC
MSTAQDPAPPAVEEHDPDDFFKDTRMSFGDHIEELRNHLWRAVYGFLIALVVSLFIGSYVLDTIMAPVKSQLDAYYNRQMRRVLSEKKDKLPELTKPSPFRKVYLYRPQVKALLAGKPTANTTRPVRKTADQMQAEKGKSNFLTWLVFGSPENEETSPLLEDHKGVTISGSKLTDDGVVEVTSNNHNLEDGATVNISGLTGNNSAGNGSFQVKVTGTNTFLLLDAPTAPNYTNANYTVTIPEDEAEDHVVELWMSTSNPLFSSADTASPIRELFQLDSPTTLRAEEAFFVWFQVCFVTGLVLGSPWIFYEIWSFVAAGLYPHEKRLVHVYLPVSLGLFIAGVLVCQFLVIPKALGALLWFNEWLGIKPDIRLNECLSFAIYMPLVFGISFQTPLVMLFLNKLGIVSVDTFAEHRRMAWFIMAVFAAVITPSTDALSMLFLWVPMSLLFELGIVLMWMNPPEKTEEESEDGELVEI